MWGICCICCNCATVKMDNNDSVTISMCASGHKYVSHVAIDSYGTIVEAKKCTLVAYRMVSVAKVGQARVILGNDRRMYVQLQV